LSKPLISTYKRKAASFAGLFFLRRMGTSKIEMRRICVDRGGQGFGAGANAFKGG
jgi:hypothetical protein